MRTLRGLAVFLPQPMPPSPARLKQRREPGLARHLAEMIRQPGWMTAWQRQVERLGQTVWRRLGVEPGIGRSPQDGLASWRGASREEQGGLSLPEPRVESQPQPQMAQRGRSPRGLQADLCPNQRVVWIRALWPPASRRFGRPLPWQAFVQQACCFEGWLVSPCELGEETQRR